MATSKTETILEMKNISLSFEGIPILKDVDFTAVGGEIHALLGANGAGKSTLMKVLSGAYRADGGTITIDEQEVDISSPKEAKSIGIQCIYQEVDTALLPDLSVAENIMIEQIKQSWINWKNVHKEANSILQSIGISLSTRKKVYELSLAEKQMVLIARAIATKAKIIIFDEPTAPLSSSEANKLFNIMRSLKSEGVSCIFISHRLQEVFEWCDRITIMRDGKRVSTKATIDTSISKTIENMIGSKLEEEYPKVNAKIGEPIIEVESINRDTRIRDISFTVHKGEIIGVFGLVGAGKTELSRLLFGVDAITAGSVKINGQNSNINNPQKAMEAGIALVPEERRKEGILIEESVNHNLSLPFLRKLQSNSFIKFKAELELTKSLISKLGIKASGPSQSLKYLSGGNQQKVSIGKWLPTNANLFLLDEPTKGVDIGAKREIFHLLGQLAEQGKGIVYFSCEIDEILAISDRILVMYDGTIVKQFNRTEATQDKLLLYASGGKEENND